MTSIQITPNQQGAAWMEAFPDVVICDNIHVNKASQMQFFHADLYPHNMDSVIVNHNAYSFEIPHAMSILGVEDGHFEDEGMYKISVSTSLSDQEKIDHSTARAAFIQLLTNIHQNGWQRHIDPTMPRFNGYDAFLYAQMYDINYSIDLDYIPPEEEWMMLENQSKWVFYADEVYLTITLMREHQNTDSPAGYYVTFDFLTKDAFQRKYVAKEYRKSGWKQAFQGITEDLQQHRKTAENFIVAQGELKLHLQYIYPDGYY